MKLMIASDIHGAAGYCRALLDAFDRERADRLLLLGDILYHGPRNDLPDDAVLEKLGVTRIEAQGQPFDPQKHDAVMHVEDENVGENTVVEVLQQGYQLGDKVLRFAMVKVAN